MDKKMCDKKKNQLSFVAEGSGKLSSAGMR